MNGTDYATGRLILKIDDRETIVSTPQNARFRKLGCLLQHPNCEISTEVVFSAAAANVPDDQGASFVSKLRRTLAPMLFPDLIAGEAMNRTCNLLKFRKTEGEGEGEGKITFWAIVVDSRTSKPI
ncbi:MAG: hypothetical protein IPK01_00815 [Acidobacteria bacterium]|nr:hypothetical protein [Acidobacteriota bacterium]